MDYIIQMHNHYINNNIKINKTQKQKKDFFQQSIHIGKSYINQMILFLITNHHIINTKQMKTILLLMIIHMHIQDNIMIKMVIK